MSNVPFLDLKRLNMAVAEPLAEAFLRTLNSGWYILGREVEEFESEFANYSEAKYCLGVANGLDAIELLLRAYDIGPGDEVIVPSNTYVATWLAVTHVGATPVPVEPDPLTHNINPLLVEAAITKNTKAILPVHLYGQPADMDPLMEIAKRHGLIVVDDAAQAQGARYKGRRVGSLAHATATSFYPGKNLGALGDGGAILTDDPKIAEKVKCIRNYGSAVKYVNDVIGKNSRLDELQAAFLRVKLRDLDEWNVRREKIAQQYNQAFADLPLILPQTPEWAESVWHLYVIQCNDREALQKSLSSRGIGTLIHYPIPPHRQKCYETLSHYKLPIAEKLAQSVLSLPMSPLMTESEVETVIAAVREALLEGNTLRA